MIISEAASKLGDAATDLAPRIAWREIRSLGKMMVWAILRVVDIRREL